MASLFQSVLGFVPSFIARGIARDFASITPPTAQRFAASIMFVDIVGFTPLSERLAQRGPLGAEQLSALLRSTFSPIIDLIEDHGGDVIRFAGDAIIVMWPAPPEPAALAETTLRAAQCALAIQAALDPDQPSDTRPALRIVISAGEVLAMTIGGRGSHWQWIVAGPTLSQVSAVQPAAQPGAVTLSGAAWSLIGAGCAGASAGAGAVRLLDIYQPIAPRPTVRPALLPSGQATLLNFVPTAILDRLIAAETMWLAELRRASVLFLFLPDLNYADPDALERVQQVWTIVQAVLNRYGGSMLQCIVDDKGTIIMLAYGVPPYIHEDNARRAVQTALDVNRELIRLGVVSAIGVTTGQVFCGDSGNQRHWEYSVIGFVVNLAARLMQSAGAAGGILCDHATYLESRSHIEFASLPSIEVKGSSLPVQVYCPLDSAPAASAPLTPLFGRADERAWLAESLAAALAGRGRIAILEGEAGIGKSRLLAQLAADAIPAGVLVILGAADSLEQRTPFLLWRAVFGAVFGLDSAAPFSRRQAILLNQAAPELRDRLALLNPILLLDLPETVATSGLEGPRRAAETRQLMIAMLARSMRERPSVLVLEDAHWMDQASWSLALDLALAMPDLALVITSRPWEADPPAEYAALSRLPAAARRRLLALDAADTAALVCQALGVRSLPPAVAGLVRDKAEGHPLWSEELAYALRDSGVVRIENGEARLAVSAGELAALEFPDSIQRVIASRIDSLGVPEQLALKVASVLGRTFAQSLVQEIYPAEVNRPKLRRYLDTLETRDLTPLLFEQPERTYIFKHALIQEVAYNTMLFSQRRELHRRAGMLLEERYAGRLNEVCGLLATHFRLGEQTAKAVRYLLQAADAAREAYAYAAARTYYADALDLLEREPAAGSPQQRLDALIKLVQVSLVSNNPQLNLARLAEAIRISESLPLTTLTTPASQRQLFDLHYAMGRAYYYHCQPAESLYHFEQMREIALHLGQPELLAVPISMIGRVISLQGHFAAALEAIRASLPALEQAGNWTDWLWNQGYVGFCQATGGQYRAGIATITAALDRAAELGHPSAAAVLNIFLTMAHWQGGDAAQSARAASTTIAIAEESGDLMPLHLAHGFRAWSAARSGDLAGAQAAFAAYDAIRQTLGGRTVYADWFMVLRAEITLLAGDAAQAGAQAAAAAAFANPIGGIFAEGLARRLCGQIAAAQGDRAASAKHFQASLDLLERGGALQELERTRELVASSQ